jgi:hypothetical protein
MLRLMRWSTTLAAAAAVTLAVLAGAESPSAAPLPNAPGCTILPATNVWNRRVDRLPVAPISATVRRTIGLRIGLHPDFGSFSGYGIPITVVPGSQARVPIRFDYASESDPGPYPMPAHPAIEAGSDRHVILIDRDACRLYETWNTRMTSNGWRGGSGAVWDLRSNALRPNGWTSADAAGLPILPGLVRYSEVSAGVIDHALRFTAPRTRSAHIYPARHHAGVGTSASLPPMGLRVRLRASFDLSRLSPQARVIGLALKRYGMILADNGSAWYVSGASSPGFDDDDLRTLGRITGADLEVVDTSHLRNGP